MNQIPADIVETLMRQVFKEVEKAIDEGNRPFGVILLDESGTVIARAHNQVNSHNDPTAHGELLLLREGGKIRNSRNLRGCKVVVNAEPCSMCMSAIVKAQIEEVYYSASQEEGNNPNVRAEFIRAQTKTPLALYKGYLEEESRAQIQRGNDTLDTFNLVFK